MKKLLFLLIASLISITVSAKGIVFETGTWNDVLAKAKETGKPVFVDVYTTWCGPCKMMSRDIFPLEEVGNFYNQNFVCYKLDAEAGEGVDLSKLYKVKGYPTYLYVRADGSIIYRFMGSCPVDAFLRLTKIAVAEFNDPKTLQDFDAEYLTHQRDTAFLRSYIVKRSRLDVSGVDLLEAFIKLLPEAESAKSGLAEMYMGQYDFMRIGTYTFNYLVQHPAIFSGKYSESIGDYLGSVALNSLRDAARKKDLALLENVLTTSKQIAGFGTNLTPEDIYMNYYRMTGEMNMFTKYLFAKCDQEEQMVFKDTLQQKKKLNVANDLNESAWQLYLTSMNKDTLQHAMRWSKRAVELAPESYSYLDTQACLFYKSGNKKVGIAMEEKVLAMIPKSSEDYVNYEKVVKRMKAGEKIWGK